MNRKLLNFGNGKLLKSPFAILPPCAVKAQGWLSNQLRLQREGILADMELYPDYNEATSQWLGETGDNWENGPYYLRGLVAAAYVVQDEALKQRAQKWIEKILLSQREDGMFGPVSNEDWWSRMPILMALRDYCEAKEWENDPDERILPFLEKYFRYQFKMLPKLPLTSWAKARGGDNIDSVYWLYNRLYDENHPSDTDWLLELATILHDQTQDWSKIMQETTVREHVVNTSQAMKTPALWYQQSGDSYDREALEKGLLHISIDHGRIDELPNSDEAARDNLSTRGSELCGIVEGMLSTEIALRILGESWLGDRLETLAYNALPAAYAPDYRGHVYYILQNQVLATTGNHEFDCDHGDSSAFAAPAGYDCCFANNHMGWPKFVQSLWMATDDDGLAAVAYGPSTVEWEIDGKKILWEEKTDYPFEEKIQFIYQGEEAFFPLKLRIPSWCRSPELTICQKEYQKPDSGTFYTIARNWSKGDTVLLSLPMEIEFSEWYNRSVALTRGPLIYSLKIGEKWEEYSDNATRELKVDVRGHMLKREVYPTSRWNYGLIDDPSLLSVEYYPVLEQPFDQNSAPIRIHAKGQIVPGWKLCGNHAAVQPYGGVVREEGAEQDIELIPYGCTRLKITHFPRVGQFSSTIYRKNPKWITRGLVRYQEFSGVFLPEAEKYSLKIFPVGDKPYTLFLNGEKVNVSNHQIEDLKTISPFCQVGFANNFRFEGEEIEAIEIVPYGKKDRLEIVPSKIHEKSITLTFPQNSFCEVDFGRDPKRFSDHILGLDPKTVKISDLPPDGDLYYRTVSFREGRRENGAVCHLKTKSKISSLSQGVSFLGHLSDPRWGWVGETSCAHIEGDLLIVGRSQDFKAIVRDGQTWSDYTVEAHICLCELTGDAGILVRTSSPEPGANAFQGYYFGITSYGAVLGAADGSWHEIERSFFEVSANTAYRLTALVSENSLICKVNGKTVFCLYDGRFEEGSAGIRSYDAPFILKSFIVRPLNALEKEELAAVQIPTVASFEITARMAFELVQVTFPKVPAQYYKIEYGTESGYYPNSVTGIQFNPYKGSSCFQSDKIAFTFTGTVCYLRMSAWIGDQLVAYSPEISVEREM